MVVPLPQYSSHSWLDNRLAGRPSSCLPADGTVRQRTAPAGTDSVPGDQGATRAGNTGAGAGRRTAAADQKGCVDMTTSPAAAAPEAGNGRVLHLSELVGRPITDKQGESIGKLADIIVRLRGAEHPLVTGLVAALGNREVFVPLEQASSFNGEVLKLTSARLDLRRFERRHGEVLLRADVLGHRLIDVPSAHLIKAVDLELRRHGSEWVLAAVDTRRRPRHLFRLLSTAKGQASHPFEDWANFEPL